MKTIDPEKNEIYKFWGIEQAYGIITKKTFGRVKGEVNKRVKMLPNIKLDDISYVQLTEKWYQ